MFDCLVDSRSVASTSRRRTLTFNLSFLSLTSILVSRFLLNLQEVHQKLGNPQLSSLSDGQLSLNFERVLGSLGSSLPPFGDTALEDDLASDDNDESCDSTGSNADSNAIPAEVHA